MQRRNTTLLTVAALLVAAAALPWLLTGDEVVEPAPVPVGPVVSPGPVPPVGEPELPATAPRVVVAVHVVEPYVPPPAVRVQAFVLPHRELLPVRLIAGTEAGPFAAGDRAGAALALVDFGEGRALLRQVDIDPMVMAEVAIGGRLVVRGNVADAAGKAIPGARVSLGELDGPTALREAVTDAEGRYELDTPAGAGVPLLVRADGFASLWRPIHVDARARLEQAVVLVADNAVAVQIVAVADGLDRARVFVVPPPTVDAALSVYPFFLQALFGGVPADAGGGAMLRGLPRHGRAGIVVLHPQLPVPGPREVLAIGTPALALMPAQLLPGRDGRIIDADGAPVVGADLVLRPGGGSPAMRPSLRFLPPLLEAAGCLVTRSDEQGAFRLGVPEASKSLLSVRAPGHAGRDIPFASLDLAEPLVLPRWRGGNLELRVLPPADGERWRCEVDVGGGVDLVLPAGAPCVVALPGPGRCRFVVTTFVGSERKVSETFADVHATGPVELQAKMPR